MLRAVMHPVTCRSVDVNLYGIVQLQYLAVANRTRGPRSCAGVQVRGRVTYNGRPVGEFQARRTAALVEQCDTHIAQLTVRETLDFAARCQGTGNRAGALQVSSGLMV